MDNLVKQPSAVPVRKVAAGGIAGIIATAIIALIDLKWPGVGQMLDPAISSGVVTVVSFATAYLTHSRA